MKNKLVSLKTLKQIKKNFDLLELKTEHLNDVQLGGVTKANKYLESFFKNRYQNYQNHISKPDLSHVKVAAGFHHILVMEIYQ